MIGRELYTAPFIWISADKCKISKGANGKPACYDRFTVTSLAIENKRIVGLTIKNSKTNTVVFEAGRKPVERRNDPKQENVPPQAENPAEEQRTAQINAQKVSDKDVKALMDVIKQKGCALNSVLGRYKVQKLEDMNFDQWNSAMRILNKMPDKAA